MKNCNFRISEDLSLQLSPHLAYFLACKTHEHSWHSEGTVRLMI